LLKSNCDDDNNNNNNNNNNNFVLVDENIEESYNDIEKYNTLNDIISNSNFDNETSPLNGKIDVNSCHNDYMTKEACFISNKSGNSSQFNSLKSDSTKTLLSVKSILLKHKTLKEQVLIYLFIIIINIIIFIL
jgi:hypothetical protein